MNTVGVQGRTLEDMLTDQNPHSWSSRLVEERRRKLAVAGAAATSRVLPAVLGAALLASACGGDPSGSPRAVDAGDAGDGAAVEPGPVDARPPFGDLHAPRSCNDAPELCARRYDEVVFLGSHLSHVVAGPTWTSPVQGRGLTAQLAVGGVRALELEIHHHAGALALCRTDCAEGSQSLASGLREIAAFVELNPDQVITFLLRSHVPSQDLGPAFEAAGLAALAHTQDPDVPWPTLAELVDDTRRLVVFVDEVAAVSTDAGVTDAGVTDAGVTDAGPTDAGAAAWLHPARQWLREAAPGVGLECVPAAGAGSLVVLHHYATDVTADDPELPLVNDRDRVATRLARCQDDVGRLPTVLLVAFAEVSDPGGGAWTANGIR